MKETIKLTCEECLQHTADWQALGRNYTAIRKTNERGQSYVIFHWLDLDTGHTGAVITVDSEDKQYPGMTQSVTVEFPPHGKYTNTTSYRLNDVPV